MIALSIRHEPVVATYAVIDDLLADFDLKCKETLNESDAEITVEELIARLQIVMLDDYPWLSLTVTGIEPITDEDYKVHVMFGLSPNMLRYLHGEASISRRDH